MIKEDTLNYLEEKIKLNRKRSKMYFVIAIVIATLFLASALMVIFNKEIYLENMATQGNEQFAELAREQLENTSAIMFAAISCIAYIILNILAIISVKKEMEYRVLNIALIAFSLLTFFNLLIVGPLLSIFGAVKCNDTIKIKEILDQ